MTNFLQMKNNLIQNFYIIGVPSEEINSRYKEIINKSNISFTPKIISKFPDINSNYNTIPNEIIIEHCFPTGYTIIKEKSNNVFEQYVNFWFELDNSKYNYIPKYQALYSKIYFTCFKFTESLGDIQKIKSELNLNDKANNKIPLFKENITVTNFIDNDNIFFPKVLCFASLLPFHKELSKILQNLYDYFDFYNKNLNKNSNNDVFLNNDLSPIEKIVEQIVMSMPFPISIRNDYCLFYNYNFLNDFVNSEPQNNIAKAKNKKGKISQSQNFTYDNTNINFQKIDPINIYMNNIKSIPLSPMFFYFPEEDVIKIFKYIILEIPILFFSENLEILSKIIEGFLSLLYPFEYVQPHISILPSKFYGIINIEDKFIFGINENYNQDFFKNNNILVDKTIIVIHFPNQKPKIEEIKKVEEQKENISIDNYNIFNFANNDSILPNGAKIEITNIDFPIKPKKKLISTIKSHLSEFKKKRVNFMGDYEHVFNQKIRYSFYKFFVYLLSGYTDYLQRINKYDINNIKNSKQDGFYFGDNIRFKSDYNKNSKETLFIKAVFNLDEFISKFSKDNHIFYKVFCNTKLFYNFIRKLIFNVDEQISLSNKYFNIITFFKQYKALKKQNKYKEKFAIYEDPFKTRGVPKPENKIKIYILHDMNFTSEEKQILIEKKKEALINYTQIIKTENNVQSDNILIKYNIFPKLLFDNDFFNISYEELFYKHYIETPSNTEIIFLYNEISNLIKEFDEKFEEIIFSKNLSEQIYESGKDIINLSRISSAGVYNSINSNGTNSNSYENLGVLVDNYIDYNWLILISCSLWYCQSPMEIEIRIMKIFDVLEKIDYIEEQVLFFLYMSIYKYGAKSHFIKMFEFINRFIGYSSYTNILYLYLKLNQKEIKEKNDINKISEDENTFKMRSFCDTNLIKNNMNNINSNIKNEIQGEPNLSKQNISGGIRKEEIDFYTLQICPKCKSENNIGIIYDMIHHRISKKREKLYYKCQKCEEDNLEIKIRYKLFINKKKEEDNIIITEGIFKLIPPHLIYQDLKKYLLDLSEYNLDIDNIFSNNKIHLLNNIFYFSDKMLPFDFLIPYEEQGNRNYFFAEEEKCEEINEESKNEIIIENHEKNKGILMINNNNNFSLINKESKK